MKIYALIPARAGSKGIPNKNLQKIGGHSLIQRSMSHALESQLIDGIVISSDSLEIVSSALEMIDGLSGRLSIDNLKQGSLSLLEDCPSNIFIHYRTAILSGDISLIGETVKEVHYMLKDILAEDVCILLLQPTTPFRSRGEVDSFIISCTSDGLIQDCVSVMKVEDHHPARMYTAMGDRLKNLGIYEEQEFAPRQFLSDVYLRDGGFYMISPTQCRVGQPVGKSSKYFVRTYPFNINIDSTSDLVLAREEVETDKRLNLA